MIRRAALLLALLPVSCNFDTEYVEIHSDPVISMEMHNLRPLAVGDGHYEAWISFASGTLAKYSGTQHEESAFVSLGKFNIDDNGKAVGLRGEPFVPHLSKEDNPQYMSDAIVTIEEVGDADNVPGAALMGGTVTGDVRIASVELAVDYADALGASFGAVQGRFLIDTPTSVDSADSASGLWFMSSLSPTEAGFLQLPPLGPGWRYEGWVRSCCFGPVENQDFMYYSTGTFSGATGFDSDSAGRNFGATGPGHPFPGQDFIGTKRLNLHDGTFEALVTIEPVPDNSPNPFLPLTLFPPKWISPFVPTGNSENLVNTSSSLPSGRIRIVR